MVETFTLEESRFRAPFTFENFKTQLETYLRVLEKEDFSLKNLGFSNRVIEELERIGPSESWKKGRLSEVRGFDEYLPFDLNQVSGCKLKQISSFDEETWTPVKVQRNYRKLSDFERRVLELHEAIYIISAREFGHSTPVATRELVSLLVDGSKVNADVRMALHALSRYGASGAPRASVSGLFKVLPDSNEICPAYLASEMAGVGSGLQISLIIRESKSQDWTVSSFSLSDRRILSTSLGQSTRYDFRLGTAYDDSFVSTFMTKKFSVSFRVRPVYLRNDPRDLPKALEIQTDGRTANCVYSDVALTDSEQDGLFRTLRAGKIESLLNSR